jgi:hypothetical protein
MNHTPTRRLLMAAVSVVAATATVTAASPAVAADLFFAKSSGRYATVSWLEVGEMPAGSGVEGNAHIGDLWVEDLGNGRASAFGTVFDLQCEPGVDPYVPGDGHGGAPLPEQPTAEGCELREVRFMEGRNVTFVLDKKLARATLTGTLDVGSGHGSTPTAAPAVSITWVGTGGTTTSRQTFSFTDEFGGTHSSRYTTTDRSATIAAGSRIGPMVFDDELGEGSSAALGTYRSLDRSRG